MDNEFHHRHGLTLSLLFSLAVHGVLFLILAGNMEWTMPLNTTSNVSPLHFEMIETPVLPENDPSEDTRLASDRALRARDTNPENRGSLPMTQGNSPVMNWPGPSSPGNEREQAPQPMSPARNRPNVAFSRDILTGAGRPSGYRSLPKDQKTESPGESGPLQLNTYAWDYAPYLLEMKRRIEKNMHPPAVFTRLGAGGFNRIRFRVDENGVLTSMEILGYQGEQVLVVTSRRAVELSAPFKPLPEGFPEPYLEVTATFHYIGIDR